MTMATPKLSPISAPLENLLSRVAIELQLPDSLHITVRKHYETLADYLAEGLLSHYSPSIYSQGSYRIQTTVRPLHQEEFDLDFIVELDLPSTTPPSDVYNAVAKQLESHPEYRGKIKLRSRCIRISFPGHFHVDVVPAIPDTGSMGTGILIPKLAQGRMTWRSTDPKGYVAWFLAQAEARVVEKAAAIEPLPPQPPASRKTALQVGVQLLKRHHQLHVSDEELRTPSIVLTTIAAGSAPGAQSIGDCMQRIIGGVLKYAEQPEHVTHPTAPGEIISEKWTDLNVVRAFQEQSAKLAEQWRQLVAAQGIDQVGKILAAMFGDGSQGPVHRAMKAAGMDVRERRDGRALRTVQGGAIAVTEAGKGHRKSTFYGDW